MRIVLFDGNPDPADSVSQTYVDGLAERLRTDGHEVQIFTLRGMDIQYCTGCWTCWWKTPGLCVFKDDMLDIYPAIVAADKLVMFSPISMGFVSSLLKKVNDRSIPVLHPYIEMVEGECHHRRRYAHYPHLALIVKEEPETDAEDLEIIGDLYRRFALNFRAPLTTYLSLGKSTLEEAAHEIGRV
jgi:multimeric flavodoxin WrbA